MIRNVVIVLSLIGLVASLGLWPLSYQMLTFRTHHFQFFAQNGALSATWIAEPERPVGMSMAGEGKVKVDTGFSLLGPDASVTTSWLPTCLFNRQYCFVLIPLWMLLVLCASALWFLWWPPHRSRRRRKLGLCVRCAYDLRGSTARCPECGEAMQNNGALGTMTDGHAEPDHT